MADLMTLQQYANKCADKLGVTPHPVLRWHTKDYQCTMKSSVLAHCHVSGETSPRGTICLHKGHPVWHKVSWWHNTIAHEVTHLAIKSNHSSVTFAKRMVNLGVADCNEKRLVKATRRHHHIYDRCISYRDTQFGIVDRKYACSICGKPERKK